MQPGLGLHVENALDQRGARRLNPQDELVHLGGEIVVFDGGDGGDDQSAGRAERASPMPPATTAGVMTWRRLS